MTKKSKFNYLNGLEITTQLSFNDWKPGFEYTKNIGIKNLNTRSVKLIYKIPRTKNFTTLLPKINSLSPGTSLTIPITFRPLEKVEYNDSIEVEILDFQKSVKIPLIAKLPQYKIAISDSLNLGACSVYESVSSSLRLTNLSDMETSFEIDIKEPFNVSVLNGEIEPKSSIELSFFFSPKSALVCEASAIIKYGSAENLNLFKKVNLYGIGKYPHILVQADDKTSSEIELQFENVLIGQNLTKFFTIINMTEVQTDFFIEKEIELTPFDRAFNCSQHIGTLLPYEKQKIAITYSPNYPSSDNVFSYLNVFSSGKLSKNRITCFASNKLPEVFLDKNLLNFGTVKTGEKNYKTFHIKNNCSCVLDFQFDNDNEFGSFKINVTNGSLQPNETKLIQVAFVPQNAAIYYKKIPCLVQNHEILFIEFIGTCHSELMKPPEIERKNLNLFYYLKSNNLLRNSPEGLIELMEQKKIFNDTTLEEVFKSNDFSLVTNSYEEYTNDDIHSFRDKYQKSIETCVTTDTHYVDFGYAQANNLDESYEKSITFTNHTRGKLIVCWNSNEERPFSIFPPTCEIPALKTYSFRVKFLPKSVDKFYNNKLEAYAFFKSLSDYNVADQRFILPSWCLNLNCIGHTFHPSSETFFPPRYSLDTDSIIFPAGVRDQELFRTFLLKNANPNCPLIFDFQNNDTNSWSIKPHKGLIKTNEHQIFVIKYVPRTDQLNFEKCHFLLNYTPSFMVSVGILGGGTLPELSLENNGLLYFPPTCRNNSTTFEYELVNLTHSKIGYEWKIPYESKNLFSVDQVECILNLHERKKSLWTFSPNKIDKYNHKVGLVAWIDGHRQTLKSYSVRMLGSCTHGSLQVADMYKDFGSVIIGSSVSNEIVVMNNNDCRLDFELYVKQSTDDAIGNKSNDNICVLELEQSMGHVEARSKRTVRCRFRPVRLVNYQFTIEYRIIYPNESSEFLKAESDTPKSMKEILCYMTANGVYPKMAIKDIKGLGSVSNISKDYLWKLISVNELNTSMSLEPNPNELIYSIATRQEIKRRTVNQQSIPLIEMNFNASPINSEDAQVVLFFENTGSVTTEWALLFPKDLLLELEYWAQNGEYTLEELEEMKVQDNKLFSIEPNKGKLKPGEMVRVTITYRHLFTGQNRLPILMKIAKGREIMLNLIGTTIHKGEPYVYFPSNKFEFEPVEIGLTDFPIQTFDLYNAGDVPARVEIDTSLVDEMNQENYASSILKCLTNSIITIPPGVAFETKWKFSPIEAKTHRNLSELNNDHVTDLIRKKELAEVIFKVNSAFYNIVTFKCIGYDKRKLNNMKIDNKSDSIPEKQPFTLSNQLATLSFDRLLLGEVPLFSKERKFLFVKNNSSEHRISFTWHVTNPDHIRFIRINPSRGVIDTNQSKLCKVTFISMDKTAFYNINLICEIKNETEMEKYRYDLELWKQEQKRQFEEFLIEEPELHERLKGIETINDNSSRIDYQDLRGKTNKSNSQLGTHRYKTIPPIIKYNNLEESNLDKVRRERAEKKLWKKPTPPSPFLLNLNVLARTQLYDEYLELSNSIKNNSTKFVDPVLGIISKQENVPIGQSIAQDFKLACNEEEKNLVDYIFSDILRSLISDKSFHSMCQKLKNEEIPYFFQYMQNEDQDEKKNENDERKTPISPKKKEKIKTDDKSTESLHKIKISPIFGSLIESIFENTLSNILTEAFYQEFNMTSRPRLIALPPKVSHSKLNASPMPANSIERSKHSSSVSSPVMSLLSGDVA